ncbi:MAG: hypothetical protein GXP33_06445 [Spirochaetes bacterium]|nr:hypothetical protein [Spirochaetota bacterium]
MERISKLNHEERVFLAGCIRAVIMANGLIEKEEVDDIDKILNKLKFTDYEKCLVDFEENIPDRDTFYEHAKKITSRNTQDVILSVIYELTLQEGVPDEEEENIFQELNKIWQKD